MNCPYCNNEMKGGHIFTRKEALVWLPLGEEMSAFQYLSGFSISRNAVELGETHYTFGSKAPALFCLDCKKIIIDV